MLLATKLRSCVQPQQPGSPADSQSSRVIMAAALISWHSHTWVLCSSATDNSPGGLGSTRPAKKSLQSVSRFFSLLMGAVHICHWPSLNRLLLFCKTFLLPNSYEIFKTNFYSEHFGSRYFMICLKFRSPEWKMTTRSSQFLCLFCEETESILNQIEFILIHLFHVGTCGCGCWCCWLSFLCFLLPTCWGSQECVIGSVSLSPRPHAAGR